MTSLVRASITFYVEYRIVIFAVLEVSFWALTTVVKLPWKFWTLISLRKFVMCHASLPIHPPPLIHAVYITISNSAHIVKVFLVHLLNNDNLVSLVRNAWNNVHLLNELKFHISCSKWLKGYKKVQCLAKTAMIVFCVSSFLPHSVSLIWTNSSNWRGLPVKNLRWINLVCTQYRLTSVIIIVS